MNVTSSRTVSSEYAVCRQGWPRYRAVQRARTIADMLGMNPATSAAMNKHQTGACHLALAASINRLNRVRFTVGLLLFGG